MSEALLSLLHLWLSQKGYINNWLWVSSQPCWFYLGEGHWCQSCEPMNVTTMQNLKLTGKYNSFTSVMFLWPWNQVNMTKTHESVKLNGGYHHAKFESQPWHFVRKYHSSVLPWMASPQNRWTVEQIPFHQQKKWQPLLSRNIMSNTTHQSALKKKTQLIPFPKSYTHRVSAGKHTNTQYQDKFSASSLVSQKHYTKATEERFNGGKRKKEGTTFGPCTSFGEIQDISVFPQDGV